MAPSQYFFIISICPVDMNKYARFYEIPSMTLKYIKETKRYGQTGNVHPQTQFDSKFILAIKMLSIHRFSKVWVVLLN